MSKYITHHRFKDTAICGAVNLPYGTELETDASGMIRTADGRAICYDTSENAKMHFAINDDSDGLARGKLSYAIAYAQRGQGARFSDEEIHMIEAEYPQWVRDGQESLLFNDAFFAAEPDDLQALATALGIKVEV